MTQTQKEQESWVKRLLDEHGELLATLETTTRFLEQPRPTTGQAGFRLWTESMADHLGKLHRTLAEHFRLETASGVFDDLQKRYPRSTLRITRLRDQHDTLLGDLRALLTDVQEYAVGTSPEDPRLRRRLADVLDRIDEHERSESELMQRMLYNDIGGPG